MAKTRLKLDYNGSIFWLIFWTIFFFPIALIMLLFRSRFGSDGKTYAIAYDGSLFWFCFWTVCFFPVAIILVVVNGISLEISDDVGKLPTQQLVT